MNNGELRDIDITSSQREEIVRLLGRYLPNTEVWVYGSRVSFTARPYSDLDMVVFASEEQVNSVFELKEAFEESSLPFRVDLFVWDNLPDRFHDNIKKNYLVLQKNIKRAGGEAECG